MQKYYRDILLICSIFYIAISDAQHWEAKTGVPEKLSFPVVTVLNGKIHVIGGGGASGATNVHYRYDPSNQKWETLAPVPYKAQQPAGCAVAGRIHYFGGGFPNSGTPVAHHYSYDPVSNSWRKETSLTAPRAIHYAAGLNDTLYSLAGQGMKRLFQAYDTLSKKWIVKADLLDDNYWYGAHVSAQGKIYRFGGGGFTAPKSDVHVYDPGTKAWSTLPSLPEGVHAINGTAIGDSIYLSGGYANGGELDKVWVYNIKTQLYTQGTKLPEARNYHRMVTIGKCIYSVGGNNDLNENMPLSLIRHCPGITTGIKAENKNSEQIIVKTLPGKLEIMSSDHSGILHLNISDLTGRTVFTGNYQSNPEQTIEIETAIFKSGLYVLTVNSREENFAKRVMIGN